MKMTIEIASFPIHTMVIFQFAMSNYQRVECRTSIHIPTDWCGCGSIPNPSGPQPAAALTPDHCGCASLKKWFSESWDIKKNVMFVNVCWCLLMFVDVCWCLLMFVDACCLESCCFWWSPSNSLLLSEINDVYTSKRGFKSKCMSVWL